ncbi:MAG: carbohydrate ABC transporter permease [Actinobacteria bacterium]|nr:carbohydrate ABC transporter permease [Actinomycetota bacterium]
MSAAGLAVERPVGHTRLGSLASHLLLIATTLVVLLPLLWVLRTAFVDRYDAYLIPPKLDAPLTLENFHQIFVVDEFTPYIINSLIVAISVTALALLLGAPAAYAIARYRTGGSPLRIGLLIGQMFPPIVLVIPIFLIARDLGMDDTLTTLVISYLASNVAFVIWSLVGYFSSIPKDAEEAALIDGCNRLQAIRRVLLPQALPGIFAAAVISFILSWNEFLFALILTGNVSRTFPVAIASLVSSRGVQIGPTCAAVTAIVLPTALFALLIKRFLVRGIALGGVKG